MIGGQNPQQYDTTESQSRRCDQVHNQKTPSAKARFPGY